MIDTTSVTASSPNQNGSQDGLEREKGHDDGEAEEHQGTRDADEDHGVAERLAQVLEPLLTFGGDEIPRRSHHDRGERQRCEAKPGPWPEHGSTLLVFRPGSFPDVQLLERVVHASHRVSDRGHWPVETGPDRPETAGRNIGRTPHAQA